MGHNGGRHGSRVRAWRAWCRPCGIYLAMTGHHSLWPDELCCPRCKRWCKVLAVAASHLRGDVILAPGSCRMRVEER